MTPSDERLWRRAQTYLAEKQYTAARIAFESFVQRVPHDVQARMLLAGTVLAEGRVQEASRQMLVAATHLPDDPDTICTVAMGLLRVGETVAARGCLDHPAIARSRNGAALARLAHVRQMLGEHDASLALMDRALACGFDNADFRYFRSIQLQFNGRIAEAEAELEHCLRLGPSYGRASLTLSRLRKQTQASNHVDAIRARMQGVAQGSEDHAAFEFALYKEFDDLGRADEAWDALARGNALMHARLGHDVARENAVFDALIARTTREFLAAAPSDAGDDGGPLPIFIVGLPRSGTTLLERIIGNHSQVISVGELGDFARQLRYVADHDGSAAVDEVTIERAAQIDFAEVGRRYLAQTRWRANGKRYYVDKLPPNYLLAGFIRRALPKAPILHMTRASMDVCFSNFRAFFGDLYRYSYAFEPLAAHYRNYHRVMAHWRAAMPGHVLDIPYARLVNDTDAVVREVLAHCRLPFEDGCADLGRNRTPVATLSSAQVREPIHARSLGEWQRYTERLAPLREALGPFAEL